MGLLDSILGNVTGSGSSGRASSTSPMMKALMLLLAAKAYQHYSSQRSAPQSPDILPDGQRPQSSSGGLGDIFGGNSNPGSTGGLGGVLSGGLGGLLGGLLGGGGLGSIVDQFRQNGYGQQMDSWISTGQNQRLAPEELAQALGSDNIDELERQTGMPRQQLLSELSEELPDAFDKFTPDGRIPTEQEASSRWV